MRKPAILALAALTAFSALIPTLDSTAEARKGRNTAIAAGVILGVAAAAALAGSSSRARASDRYDYDSQPRRSGFWATCDKWLRQCNRGNDYSCEKYETRGCTE